MILFFGVWFFLKNPIQLFQKKNGIISSVESNLEKKIDDQALVEKTASAPILADLPGLLQKEAALIGRIDSQPEDTLERLQKWAQNFNYNQINELQKIALDIQKPQDDRFLAVMLIGWSRKPEALENLKVIALAKVDSFLSPNRLGDFENIIRMQAIDGMISLQARTEDLLETLKIVASKSDDSNIADRSHRAIWATLGQAKKPEEQDKKALEEILKK